MTHIGHGAEGQAWFWGTVPADDDVETIKKGGNVLVHQSQREDTKYEHQI